ncbi:Calcium-dependent phosphotriesterase superfamily protein, partial [Thalictrum thalictroides]
MASVFSCCCSTKFLILLFIISAVPIGFIISLERSIHQSTTDVYKYHSNGWLRECIKWDDLDRRFIVSYFEGGVGQIPVPENYTPGTVLEEETVIKDNDLAGNGSLGLVIDRVRNRVLIVNADVLGNLYSALAAYDLNTWNRLFLTQLSGS